MQTADMFKNRIAPTRKVDRQFAKTTFIINSQYIYSIWVWLFKCLLKFGILVISNQIKVTPAQFHHIYILLFLYHWQINVYNKKWWSWVKVKSVMKVLYSDTSAFMERNNKWRALCSAAGQEQQQSLSKRSSWDHTSFVLHHFML